MTMLKIIAILSMLIDHIGIIFFPGEIFFSLVGRLAFPLFCWSVAEGFIRTRNSNKYLIRLSAIAIVSQIPYYYLFNNFYLNVCFTLAIGLLSIKVYSSSMHYFLKALVIIGLLLITDGLQLEYGMYGVLSVLLFFIFRNKLLELIMGQTIITIFAINLYSYQDIQIVALSALLLITGFKKYDFKINKLVNYFFYPLHLTMLYFLMNFN
ncbi:hypothetical protein PAEVO_43350 [Paenibacillus sp. GM2FR]|nr:hypothetical protein PAEVO_43350 [Paenibacillus sp. GM2FR]